MEHRLLSRSFKVKIRLRSNPKTTCFSFWDYLMKFNATCRHFLIPGDGSNIVNSPFDLGNISLLFSFVNSFERSFK